MRAAHHCKQEPSLVPRPHPLRWVGTGDICFSFGPYALSGQSDVLIQVYCDLIGYIEENGRLNNMAAGPKLWRKSPDPTQRSGWGLGTRLGLPMILICKHLKVPDCCKLSVTT